MPGRRGIRPDRLGLLTTPRFLWWGVNPVSFRLAWKGGALLAVIAEVTNSWGERHAYVRHHPDGRPIAPEDTLTAARTFHVSPFQDMAGDYAFRFAIRAAAPRDPAPSGAIGRSRCLCGDPPGTPAADHPDGAVHHFGCGRSCVWHCAVDRLLRQLEAGGGAQHPRALRCGHARLRSPPCRRPLDGRAEIRLQDPLLGRLVDRMRARPRARDARAPEGSRLWRFWALAAALRPCVPHSRGRG